MAETMRDSEFLEWIYDRMKLVYKENELADYMHTLKDIVNRIRKLEDLAIQSDGFKARLANIMDLQQKILLNHLK